MASRLSKQQLPAIYNGGCLGLPFNKEFLNIDNFWDLSVIDQALKSEDPRKAIQKIAPQKVFQALIARGAESSLDVIKELSLEQYSRILDYDTWKDNELLPQRFFYWFNLMKSADPELAFNTFRKLESEYQIAPLCPFVRIYDQETYEKLSDCDQDQLYRFPGDAFFYEIVSDDKSLHKSIEGLVELTLSQDINYAFSLLTHAAMLPPLEQEHLLSQFRLSRLEEDGFVEKEKAMELFSKIQEKKLKNYKTSTKVSESIVTSESTTKMFLDEVLENIKTENHDIETIENIKNSFLYLANAMTTITDVELDNINAFSRLLLNIKAMCSLALEYTSDKSIKVATTQVKTMYPKKLFTIGYNLIKNSLTPFAQQLKDSGFPKGKEFYRYFTLNQHGLLLNWIDVNLEEKLDLQDLETLKGIFNRFPQYVDNNQQDELSIRLIPVFRTHQIEKIELFLQKVSSCLEKKNIH